MTAKDLKPSVSKEEAKVDEPPKKRQKLSENLSKPVSAQALDEYGNALTI